jgi:hypothetical protein
MLKEIVTGVIPGQLEDNICADLDEWTAKLIAKALSIDLGGKGLLPQTPNLAKKYFDTIMNARELEISRMQQAGCKGWLRVVRFLPSQEWHLKCARRKQVPKQK